MFQSKDVEEVALQGLSHRSIASRDITTTGLCWPKNDTGAAFSCAIAISFSRAGSVFRCADNQHTHVMHLM